MPRRTRKYVTACDLANQLQIDINQENQEVLYRKLQEYSYYWNSSQQEWIEDLTEADAPTELIKVRVWTDKAKVKGVAYQLRCELEEVGYIFMEQSEVYDCHSLKQLEGRIYLTFR